LVADGDNGVPISTINFFLILYTDDFIQKPELLLKIREKIEFAGFEPVWSDAGQGNVKL
jgi:hypothetical protein